MRAVSKDKQEQQLNTDINTSKVQTVGAKYRRDQQQNTDENRSKIQIKTVEKYR